ncbi:hypothetical protein EV176_003354, partial [Coemansia sp. RSA 451]
QMARRSANGHRLCRDYQQRLCSLGVRQMGWIRSGLGALHRKPMLQFECHQRQSRITTQT